MRARMAVSYSGISVELREVDLRNKPQAMLQVSPKATVPVLVLDDGSVLEESLDIMRWALAISDPDGWLTDLNEQSRSIAKDIIAENDGSFKQHLDQYKYADRFPELAVQETRRKGEEFLAKLDERLQQSRYLISDQPGFVDVAVFPFIRQFAYVDKAWFDATNFVHLQRWLQRQLDSRLFQMVMKKEPVWVAVE